MKTGYIICTASGWYWKAYSVVENAFSHSYTLFGSEAIAEIHLQKAKDCRNGVPVLEIKKVYY